MARRVENRAFVINQLRAMAADKKTPPTVRRSCLDRIAIMEKFYPVVLTGESVKNQRRDNKTEADLKAEAMMEQLGGDSAS